MLEMATRQGVEVASSQQLIGSLSPSLLGPEPYQQLHKLGSEVIHYSDICLTMNHIYNNGLVRLLWS